ncbi:MAG TPA: oligosaccharide flippase family protein [Candidatus Methanoperedens sp.]|nr:oligosaccharide flippase family protein [Candidatus Methanoperedens sp.]
MSDQTPSRDRVGRTRFNIVKNVTSNWAALFTNIAVSFFLAPFIVQSLGNVFYGVWTLVMQFTGYMWLFDLGVRESVIKYVAQYEAAKKQEEVGVTVNAALFLYTFIAALTMAVVAGLAYAMPYFFNIPPNSVGTARIALLLTGASIAQGFVANVFVGVLMGLQRFYLVSRLGIVFSLIRALLTVIALSAGHGIVALGVIHLTMNTLVSLIVFRYARIHLPYYSPRLVVPGREEFGRIAGYAKYVVANNIGEKLVFSTDALVVGIFLPISSLTYYAIGGSPVGYLRSMVLMMVSVMNPVSSALEARQDTQRLGTLFLGASKAAMLIGLPVCIGLIVLGGRFIGLWMGPQYSEVSGQILAILGASSLVGLPHFTIGSVLYGLGRHRIIALCRAAEAAVNLTLSILLVQRLGLVGVALGTLIPHVLVAGIVLPYLMARVLPIKLRDYYISAYLRPLLASGLFVLACLAIERFAAPQSLPAFGALVATALVVYVVPCWMIALTGAERGAILARARAQLENRRARSM